MTESANAPGNSDTEPRWVPASPGAALLPGALLLFVGLWIVTGGGPLGLGWASFSAGLALVLVGAVAQGVVWGLDIHTHRGR